jgi:hypothetical protein
VIKRLNSGDEEVKLDYCYIDDLVITRTDVPVFPKRVFFNRCVIGRLRIVDEDIDSLDVKAIVLDELSLGKTWKDDKVNTVPVPAEPAREREGDPERHPRPRELPGHPRHGAERALRDDGVRGTRGFPRHALRWHADFRYSVFGEEANYKRMTLTNAAFFGNTRYTGAVTFREMRSLEDLYFNSAVFEGPASFDLCEWTHGATFEDSTFGGPVTFDKSRMGGRLNMSRTRVKDRLALREMELGGMDFIGAVLEGDTDFIDVHFKGKVRFSLDDVTRAQFLSDPTPLLALYRDYQGDKDRETPLTEQSSYGVTHVDDLIARVRGNISFNNSVFTGFCIFDRVAFGVEGKPRSRSSTTRSSSARRTSNAPSGGAAPTSRRSTRTSSRSTKRRSTTRSSSTTRTSPVARR